MASFYLPFLRFGLKLFAYYAIYIILRSIYRLTLHPLAKYPGPILAKLTDVYAGYHAWKGDIHLDMWRCHVKYGKFVRYAPNVVNTNTTTGLSDIYSNGKNFTKSKHYKAMVHQALNTLTLRDKKEHGRRRRIISQGFSDAAIRSFNPEMVTTINKFCDCLINDVDEISSVKASPDGWQPARDMSKWCSFLSFDVMSDLIFGRSYDLLGKNTYRYVVQAIEQSNVRVSVLLQSPWLKIARLDKHLFPRAILGRNLFIKFVGKLLRDTMKLDKATRKDFFARLSTTKDPQTGEILKREEIVAESTTLVVAGADTSATATTSVFFYLSRNAAAYARASAEVRKTFQTLEEVQQGGKLVSCVFLRACIEESLRMSPPVGSSLYREALKGGAFVDGEYFPRRSNVGTPIYSIHHNPAYFPEPFKFCPERWIVGEAGSTTASVERAHSAYIPFSFGARSCLGKGMALTELMLTMATVLWRLDFKVADTDASGGRVGAEAGRDRVDELQLVDHVTSAGKGPVLHFRARRWEQEGGELVV